MNKLKMLGDAVGSIDDSLNQAGVDQPDIFSSIQPIIMVVLSLIGLIAVVMIIIGGVQYSTSQGAADKVKKAKDTIMYGIIGLVIVILAFAIVNFVLGSVI